jgi:hypothetical protein
MKQSASILIVTLTAALFAGCTHKQTVKDTYPTFPFPQQIRLSDHVVMYRYTLPKFGAAHIEIFADDESSTTAPCKISTRPFACAESFTEAGKRQHKACMPHEATYSCTVDEDSLSGKIVDGRILFFD